MRRRNFIQSVVSLPVVPSLPDLSDIGKTERDKDQMSLEDVKYWKVSASYDRETEESKLLILDRDSEILYDFSGHDGYSDWYRTSVVNLRQISDCAVPVNLADMDMVNVYTNDPFFSVVFEDTQKKITIAQNKFGDTEYCATLHDGNAGNTEFTKDDDLDEVVRTALNWV